MFQLRQPNHRILRTPAGIVQIEERLPIMARIIEIRRHSASRFRPVNPDTRSVPFLASVFAYLSPSLRDQLGESQVYEEFARLQQTFSTSILPITPETLQSVEWKTKYDRFVREYDTVASRLEDVGLVYPSEVNSGIRA